MRAARRRGWASDDFAGPAVLALAPLAYSLTLWIEGNGFVAAFVGGLAFGNSAGREAKEVVYVEQTAGLVSVLTGCHSGRSASRSSWSRPAGRWPRTPSSA